jgi:hypothetical protein
MNQDQSDQDWLQNLKKPGNPTHEAHRVGIALRKRVEAQLRETPNSDGELERLQLRLEKESLLKRSTAIRTPLLAWITDRWSHPWSWAFPLAALTVTALWIVRPHQESPRPVAIDELTAYRGLDLSHPTRLYTDLALAGHQYQIVPDAVKAESEWKSALIEAGILFDTHRSPSLPNAIEIHIRLSAAIDRLEHSFALPKAPHQGEWIVYLISEQP